MNSKKFLCRYQLSHNEARKENFLGIDFCQNYYPTDLFLMKLTYLKQYFKINKSFHNGQLSSKWFQTKKN